MPPSFCNRHVKCTKTFSTLGYFVSIREYWLENAAFVHPSCQIGDKTSEILAPLGFAHYRLPLQKQWKAPHSQLNFSVSVRNGDMSINNSWRVSKIPSSPEHLQTPTWLHFGLHTAFLHLHAVFLLSAPCVSSHSTVPPGTVIAGDTLSFITKMHLHIMLASYMAPHDN